VSIEESALKTMMDAGMPEAAARELLGHARAAGSTMSGAERIIVVRQGPWEWLIASEDGEDEMPPLVVDTPQAVLLEVAKRLHGGSSDILDVTIVKDERKPWER
jgi:hypothetical protein